MKSQVTVAAEEPRDVLRGGEPADNLSRYAGPKLYNYLLKSESCTEALPIQKIWRALAFF